MATSTAIAVYFLIWWVVLFAVLPWGVRAQGDNQSEIEADLDDDRDDGDLRSILSCLHAQARQPGRSRDAVRIAAVMRFRGD